MREDAKKHKKSAAQLREEAEAQAAVDADIMKMLEDGTITADPWEDEDDEADHDDDGESDDDDDDDLSDVEDDMGEDDDDDERPASDNEDDDSDVPIRPPAKKRAPVPELEAEAEAEAEAGSGDVEAPSEVTKPKRGPGRPRGSKNAGGPKKPRRHGLGRLELAMIEYIRKNGDVPVHRMYVEQGGPFKNPRRIVQRLTEDGVLYRKQRGIYGIRVPLVERLAAMRAAAIAIRTGEAWTAPHALSVPSKRFGVLSTTRITKGSVVAVAPRAAAPGDVVLVTRRPDKDGRVLRMFLSTEAGHGAAKARAYVLGHDDGSESVAVDPEMVLQPVVGFYWRCTRSAAAARAEEDIGAGMDGEIWKPPAVEDKTG